MSKKVSIEDKIFIFESRDYDLFFFFLHFCFSVNLHKILMVTIRIKNNLAIE